MKELSIVVPTFNEKDNVLVLYERLSEALSDIPFEVIYVDDSIDETPIVLESMQMEYNNIRFVHRTTEKGLASAVVLGFSLAEGKYISVMDADLQHPPEIMKDMYLAISKGFDFCIPSRFIPGGSDGGLNFYRKFVSWTARVMGKVWLKSLHNISDPTSGLFMFRRECISNVELHPIGWKIMVEVLALADYSTVVEIPYSFCERFSGESKLDSKVSMEYIKQLKNLRRIENRKRKVQVSVGLPS